MGTEFAARRRLLRKITRDVSSVEGVEALQDYFVANLPSGHASAAAFLIARRSDILSIPSGILDEDQRLWLLNLQEEGFRMGDMHPSTLAVLVRYLLPPSPGGRPDPSNSLWKTRLKLLTNTGGLVSFICLWRLWNKYQHNQQMNHSIPEIEADLASVVTAIDSLSRDKALVKTKVNRFKRLVAMIFDESSVSVLKELEDQFAIVAADLHKNDSSLELVLYRQGNLVKLLQNSSRL